MTTKAKSDTHGKAETINDYKMIRNIVTFLEHEAKADYQDHVQRVNLGSFGK